MADDIPMKFLRQIGNIFSLLFTGGQFGATRGNALSSYEKRQQQRQKDFAKFGGHECKRCRTRIPANKSYCGACYHAYINK